LDFAERRGEELIDGDRHLRRFVNERRKDVARAHEDYERLVGYAKRRKWDIELPYDPVKQQRALTGESGVSMEAQRRINSKRFNYVIASGSKPEIP